MIKQFQYFLMDIRRLLGRHKIRIVHVWLSRAFWGIFLYRFERGLFLSFGRFYPYARIVLIPVYNLLQAYSNIDIHYKADIRGGIIVLHPSAGVVVSGKSRIGKNLTLTGGNIIGVRAGNGDIIIGINCTLGANAVIIGPVTIADNIQIGACACVVENILESNISVVGVPAKPILPQLML